MNYLTLENISKAFGDNVLFQNLSFSINKGQKVAFVARNGTGKSSLLKIIAGLDSSDGDQGKVLIHKDIRTGYLDQNPYFQSGQTVLESIFDSDTEIINVVREYEIAMLHPDDQSRIEKAVEKMDALKAWDYEVTVKQILSQLDITNLEQKVDTLSGGQQKRLALARVLLNEPDFIILDEPTNHLDLDMIEWLEEYLTKTNLTLLMVTHDRYFLERVCDTIIELDKGKLYKYKGNYSYFLEKKTAREEQRAREVNKARSLMKTELEWIRRMPKARGTKAKARVNAFKDLKEKASQKLGDRKMEIEIQYTRLGGKIVELHNVSKNFEKLNLIKPFSYKFKKNERLGIIGKNGSGKTTFLKMLMEIEKPSSGKIVVGSTVNLGYYSQDGIKLNENKKVIDIVRDVAEYIQGKKGRKLTAAMLLERFLFPKDQHWTYVHKLSGGEKRRLYLLTVLMTNPNFLILDEPTNDLDIITLNVLEDFLLEFEGCIIIVSHDRYFMDKIVNHLFVFKGDGTIKDFPGNYSDFRNSKLFGPAVTQKSKPKESPGPQEEKPMKLSHEQQKEVRRIEKDIQKLEKRKAEINEKFTDLTLDHEEILQLSNELNKINQQLEEKEDRWLELSEINQ